LTFDRNLSAVVGYDALRNGKPEAGSDAGRLRGEKRVEDKRYNLPRYAGARILYTHHGESRDFFPVRRNSELPAPGHGVDGVHHGIAENEMEEIRIRQNPETGVRIRFGRYTVLS